LAEDEKRNLRSLHSAFVFAFSFGFSSTKSIIAVAKYKTEPCPASIFIKLHAIPLLVVERDAFARELAQAVAALQAKCHCAAD
jgi:hypothetical protein